MNDLSNEAIPVESVCEAFRSMKKGEWHTFEILTSAGRPAGGTASMLDWPESVWTGVSIENRRFVQRADRSAMRGPRCGRIG